MKTPWRMIEGMPRQTASYWKASKQKIALDAAGQWFFALLKKHAATNVMPSSASGLLRDDIADFLAGNPVKLPKAGLSAPALPKRRGKGFAGGGSADC